MFWCECTGAVRFLGFGGRVSPRRATHFLCFAKESKQRKATPTVCVPPLRCGQPAVLDSGGGPQNSLRSNSCGPDPASICAPRRSQKGWKRAAFASLGPNTNSPIPTTAGAARLRWPGGRAKQRPVWFALPSVCAEERSVSRIRARPCLSEASLGETPRNVSTAGCPQRSGGSQTVGSPFFCLRFFGEAKKRRSPAGARPGPGTQCALNSPRANANSPTAIPKA
ncbi:hypothetical protein VAPA_1c39590 [Variovorax paradoxus B4]|uniref:Uncharacterized protein n=1 Tax=Variovorax paradoxus B4 TaxID=1246301 RepID=T1XDL9_VARPD|nr:hypothetical protein VAPA_1c39590 [Variovorax paradoxus B4]